MKKAAFELGDYIVVIVAAIIIGAVFVGAYWAHRDDERLKRECEARDGTFVEAREPLHLCIREVK